MTFLLLHLLVLAFVTAAAALAWAHRLQLRRSEEWIAPPSVDYSALHAQWERERHWRAGDGPAARLQRSTDRAGGAGSAPAA